MKRLFLGACLMASSLYGVEEYKITLGLKNFNMKTESQTRHAVESFFKHEQKIDVYLVLGYHDWPYGAKVADEIEPYFNPRIEINIEDVSQDRASYLATQLRCNFDMKKYGIVAILLSRKRALRGSGYEAVSFDGLKS